MTFLHKFNPEQFELIKFRKGNDGKDLSINGKCPYFRILIKNKKIQNKSEESRNKANKQQYISEKADWYTTPPLSLNFIRE
ncbi:adenine-specific methyltransferase EcoRI family protein [Hugenholtzia roseola]|uniref:adenine-specific methyltransferase EcoRI family protein n=1 Tax=Hugenholtzia roseola TaxID=1002 RepID=UPI003CCBFF48